MSTVPKITNEHWHAADKATGGYNYVDMCNKAIEIALAEQQENKYIKQAQPEPVVVALEEINARIDKKLEAECKDESFSTELQELAEKAIAKLEAEPVDPHAALRAEYIRQRDAVPCELGFYLWEYKGATEIDHPLVWTEGIGESVFKCFTLVIRCTDISCYVSKDGESAIRMLIEDAVKILKDTKNTKLTIVRS